MRKIPYSNIRRLKPAYPFPGCVGLSLIQAACVSYQYVPPATEAGLQCVTTCQVAQQNCVAAANGNAAREAENCEIERSHTEQLCLVRAKSDMERQSCSITDYPGYCMRSANTWGCSGDFRTCYSACGGHVIEEHH